MYEVIKVMEKVDRNKLLISVENWVSPDGTRQGRLKTKKGW